MKKILLIILVSFVLVGCTKPSETSKIPNKPIDTESKEAYLKAVNNIYQQTSIDMTMTMYMDVSGAGENDETQSAQMEVKVKNNDNLEASEASMVTSMGDIKLASYLKDGNVYVDFLGDKSVEPIQESDLQAFDYDQLTEHIIVLESLLNKMEKSESGNHQIYTLELNDPDEISTLLQNNDSNLLDSFITDEEIRIDRIFIEMTIDENDRMIRYDMELNATQTEREESAIMKIELVVNAYGDDVVVDFPDLSEFKREED